MKTMGSGALGNSETRRIVSDVVNDATDGGNTGGMLSFLTFRQRPLMVLNAVVLLTFVHMLWGLSCNACNGVVWQACPSITITMSPEAGLNTLCLLSAPAPLLQTPATERSVRRSWLL